MKTRSAFILLLGLLLIFVLQDSSSAEDWSIRKFNPFGPKTIGKKSAAVKDDKRTKKTSGKTVGEKKEKSERVNSGRSETRPATPSTTVDIQRRFALFGRETAAAFKRTRNALTPQFDWPKWEPLRIKFPSLMPNTEPEKVVK